MTRDIKALKDREFDLLVIGGGIYGAMLCWQASAAGLSVAMIEKEDFAGATSSNSQKIIHGGLRYLQSLDFPRVMQSIRETRSLSSFAPHLIRPLRCVMPIYGNGSKGWYAVAVGLKLYNLVTDLFDGVSGLANCVPKGKTLSKHELNGLVPGLPQSGLNGGAEWHDALCLNTERLVVNVIKSGCDAGAVAANYVRATNIKRNKGPVVITKATEVLKGEEFEIRSKKVANCTGPWFFDLLSGTEARHLRNKIGFVAGINVVTRSIFEQPVAVGIRGLLDGNSRVYFLVPWRGKSIIGTEWYACSSRPDDLSADEYQCTKLIDGFNKAYPPAKLSLYDIVHVHCGLVPCRMGKKGGPEARILKRFKILDHDESDPGKTVSVLGVKYTTARDVAERVLRYLYPGLNRSTHSFSNSVQPQVASIHAFDSCLRPWTELLPETEMNRLAANYGSEAAEVLKLAEEEPSDATRRMERSVDIVGGEALFAIRNEMAQKLSDVVMRRTDRGTAGIPDESELERMAVVMAREMGWSEPRREAELREVREAYPRFL